MNNTRLVLFYTLLLLLFLHRPALGDEAAVMQEMARLTGLSGNPCHWFGVVECSSGKVHSIDLHGKSLTGELPRDLNQLSELRRLNVMGNNLKGSLPDLSNLANLQEARFDSNQFTDVPAGHLSGLTSLLRFSIDNNHLVSWDVFRELKDSAPELIYFSANNASLTGPIPDIIGSFPVMQNLHLAYNKIEGPLPASLAGSGIQTLWLDNQKLSGRIDVIGSMPWVQQVWLHANRFSGPIPDLSNCKELADLELGNNHFSGPIPPSLTSLPDLMSLDVSDNNLSGKVPTFHRNLALRTSGNPFIGIDLPPPSSPASVNPPPASSGSINRLLSCC